MNPKKIVNPTTQRRINVNGVTHKKLIRKGIHKNPIIEEMDKQQALIVVEYEEIDKQRALLSAEYEEMEKERIQYFEKLPIHVYNAKYGFYARSLEEKPSFRETLAVKVDELPMDIMTMIMMYLDFSDIDNLFAPIPSLATKILYNNNHPMWKFLVQRDLTENFHIFQENAHLMTFVGEYKHYIKIEGEFCINNFAHQGYEKAIQKAILKGFDIDVLNGSSIRTAASKGYIHIVLLLMKAGSQSKLHAFNAALMNEQIEIAEAILNYMPEVIPYNLKDIIKSGHIKSIQFLINHGFNVKSSYDEDVRSHLLINGHENMVTFMESILSS